MLDHPEFAKPSTPASVTVTARHMAEAVGYLIRVAMEAGLGNVALRLSRIRANLVKISNEPSVPADGDASARVVNVATKPQ